MSTLEKSIESLLLVSNKPLTIKRLSDVLDSKEEEVERAMERLIQKADDRDGGVTILRTGKQFQLVSHPHASSVVRKFLQDEQTGELTRPSLETLTIVAYRSPIKKSELELIRGVNCSLILRNLMIRGLVEEERDAQTGESTYRVTTEFLKWLGIKDVTELPDFKKLSSDELINQLLLNESRQDEKEDSAS